MKINRNIDKKKSKFKIILTTFCCLLGLFTFCSASSVASVGNYLPGWSSANSAFVVKKGGFETLYGGEIYKGILGLQEEEYFFWTLDGELYTHHANSEQGLLGKFYFCDTFTSSSNFLQNCATLDYTSSFWKDIIQQFMYNIDSSDYWGYDTDAYQGSLVCISSHVAGKSFCLTDKNSMITPNTSQNYSYYTSLDLSVVGDSPGLTYCDRDCILSGYVLESSIDTNYCFDNAVDSLDCQTEYSLIPVSSVDSNYCESNNLCSNSGGGDCGTGENNWSALFINDIQHLGKPIISIDIPEEINWDYTSTDSEFNVEIVGYNVDYEKMSEILSVQQYKPTSEDFTQSVGILAPYMKILLFILFVFIVIKRLKKPFKSRLK